MNKKLKLLYAEDEYKMRKDYITYIESRYDFEIYEASDGLEALELYKKNMPDIVLTDITMPNMCGLEFVEEIRKISKFTQIIVLTAHSDHDMLMQALNLHVINYILKPINRKKLNDSLNIAIETIAKSKDINKEYVFLGQSARFNIIKHVYYDNDEIIKLSKSESRLLELLCIERNRDISSYDIFVHVWDDFEKEFSTDSVRTLVKKLRKKLPDGILENIYGGFYKLNI